MRKFLAILLVLTVLVACSTRNKEFIDVNKAVAIACEKPREVEKPNKTCLYSLTPTSAVDTKAECLALVYYDTVRYSDALQLILDGYKFPLPVS